MFFILFYLFTNLIQMLDLKSYFFSKDSHAFWHLHTPFHLSLTQCFTITYTPTSYTLITSINTPFWLPISHIFTSNKFQTNFLIYSLPSFLILLSSLFSLSHPHKSFISSLLPTLTESTLFFFSFFVLFFPFSFSYSSHL